MAEYINREKAKRLFHIEYAYAAAQLLDEIPSADVAPVVHGRWIYEEETLFTPSGYRCSVCRRPRWLSPDVPEAFKYCPNCGAKMDGGDADA